MRERTRAAAKHRNAGTGTFARNKALRAGRGDVEHRATGAAKPRQRREGTRRRRVGSAVRGRSSRGRTLDVAAG